MHLSRRCLRIDMVPDRLECRIPVREMLARLVVAVICKAPFLAVAETKLRKCILTQIADKMWEVCYQLLLDVCTHRIPENSRT